MSTSPLESQIINLLKQETTKQLTVKQISEYLGKDLGNISRKINNLVKNGTLKKSQFRTGDKAHANMIELCDQQLVDTTCSQQQLVDKLSTQQLVNAKKNEPKNPKIVINQPLVNEDGVPYGSHPEEITLEHAKSLIDHLQNSVFSLKSKVDDQAKILAQNGIIQDEIGIKYNSEYDLIHQIQDQEKTIADLKIQINNLSIQQLVNPTTCSQQLVTNNLLTTFDPAIKEKFYEWLKTQNFPTNPMFLQFKKHSKRATFDQCFDLYMIFLSQNP